LTKKIVSLVIPSTVDKEDCHYRFRAVFHYQNFFNLFATILSQYRQNSIRAAARP